MIDGVYSRMNIDHNPRVVHHGWSGMYLVQSGDISSLFFMLLRYVVYGLCLVS